MPPPHIPLRLAEIPLERRVESALRRFFPCDWEDRLLAWTERERRSRSTAAANVPRRPRPSYPIPETRRDRPPCIPTT